MPEYFLDRIDELDSSKVLLSIMLTQLNFVRCQTVAFLSKLTIEELDEKAGEGFNSIGTILKHIAANEYYYQLITFQNRTYNEEERNLWKGAITGELILGLISGNPVSYYLDIMEKVREKTIFELLQKDDKWLLQDTRYKFSSRVNNWYCWFHVMEDEISHLGQIKILLKQITKSFPKKP